MTARAVLADGGRRPSPTSAARADAIAAATGATAVDTEALPGAGSAPGTTIPSAGVRFDGDHLAALRAHDPPVIARARDGVTVADLRAVEPADDAVRRGGPPPVRVIATAGHVDHGKSSLVLALTGTDPDRFAEEKRRGLTIDLGFAHTVVDGEPISFVDVPGHVRFLRNMLAGVGGVDACLFVVAATEGWKPQSEEHLRILELVGVRHGVVALTKVDVLDDPELVELAALEVAERTAGTFLAGAPIVPVAAPSGRGLARARRPPSPTLARTTPAARDRGRARLWIDRVFAAKGSGTVVTGTLTDGAIATGDHLALEPHGARRRGCGRSRRSGGRSTRSGPATASPSTSVGVDHTRAASAATPSWRPTAGTPPRWSTPRCTSSTALDHAGVAPRAPTSPTSAPASTPCGCACSARTRSPPGGEGLVRLHLATALPLLPGDRYVLRESGRDETVGGGEILDVAPVRPASRARPDRPRRARRRRAGLGRRRPSWSG